MFYKGYKRADNSAIKNREAEGVRIQKSGK